MSSGAGGTPGGASGEAGSGGAVGGSGGEGAVSSGAGGTTGGAGGEAASGGNGGTREPDGLICQSPERCAPGEICTGCTTMTEGTSYVCVPNPDDDPAGFADATEQCAPGVGDHFAECDGPEDCPSDHFCVWGHDPQATFGGQCVTEGELPEPLQRASCCFTCGALPLCVLCETEADCPDTLECAEVPSAPNAVNGCRQP
jgi:hypothetical protein